MFQDQPVVIAPQVYVLPRFVDTVPLREKIEQLSLQAGFRHMTVPGGKTMKVALTNCGQFGWHSDAKAYRYSAVDPSSDMPWPEIPDLFTKLGQRSAALCGFEGFEPDACLVNRYVAGAGMGLHQDRNEKDYTQPIVSVSIGATCKFILGGLQRNSPTHSFALNDGDVMVWGGESRLVFHGVRPLPVNSDVRYNITLRRAM